MWPPFPLLYIKAGRYKCVCVCACVCVWGGGGGVAGYRGGVGMIVPMMGLMTTAAGLGPRGPVLLSPPARPVVHSWVDWVEKIWSMGLRGACAASGNLESGNRQESIRFLDPCIDITKPFKKISISVKFDRFLKFFLEFINLETRQCRAGI